MVGKMEEELIQYLISIGALEYCFTDDDGSYIYRLTPEAKDLVPDLYDEHMKQFNTTVFSLWNKGLIDIVFDDDGEPLIGLNENSDNKEMIKKLDITEADILKEIKFVWKQKNKEDE